VLGPRPGLEIVHPLAVVLLGGLVTIALVTLFALPAIYRHVAPDPPPEPLADEDQLARSADHDTAAPPGDDGQPRQLATVGPSTQGRP
jgi:hypothetical protein